MKNKLAGFNARGFGHPEIRKGDQWKDTHGSIVTIESYRLGRVTFYRSGYEFPCVLPTQRFIKTFTFTGSQNNA